MRLEKKSIPQLKKQADNVTSELVRRSAADWQGRVSCFTCGKTFHWKEIQAGHYISRVYTNTRWLLKNIRPQCVSCNIYKRGNMDEYSIRLEKETPGILEELNRWKHTPSTPLKRLDLIVLIEEYKEKIHELEGKNT